MSGRCCGRTGLLVAALLFCLTTSVPVRAQPWVPLAREGSVSVVYQHIFVRDHLFSGGLRADVGHIRSHSLTADIDYGLTDRLSVSASLPFVAAKYNGAKPHLFPSGETFDNNRYNRGLQDFRLDVRYNVIELPVSVTPFVALNLPSHDYEYFAHSAIGLNLKELQIGTYAGLLRAPFYVHGRYSYGIFERALGERRSRSNIDAEVGWLVTPRVRVFAYQLGQVRHGGLELFPGFPNLTEEEVHHHDRLGRLNMMDIGAGTAIALTPSMDLVGGVLTTVAGENTHAVHYGLTVGASWTFGRRSPRHASSSAGAWRRPQRPISSARVN